MDPKARWLIPMMLRLAARPAMYLGDTNVRSVYTFFTGYCWARNDLGVAGLVREDEELLARFVAWLQRRTGERYVEWVHHTEHLDASPRNAMTFFTLFKEFLASEGEDLNEWSRDERCPPSLRTVSGSGHG